MSQQEVTFASHCGSLENMYITRQQHPRLPAPAAPLPSWQHPVPGKAAPPTPQTTITRGPNFRTMDSRVSLLGASPFLKETELSS